MGRFGSRRPLLVCLSVLAGLTLFACAAPSLDSPHSHERAEAIRALTDQRLLEDIALSNRPLGERYAAVSALEDQERLARIAIRLDKPLDRVGEAAVDRIADMEILLRLVTGHYGPNEHLFPEAMRRLKTPELLERVVMETTGESSIFAASAIRQLKAPERLERIAAGHALETWRKRAAVRLTDVRAQARLAGVGDIQDQAVLRDLALHDPDGRVQMAALERLVEPAYLVEVAIAADNWSPLAGKRALEMLEDQARLAEVAEKAQYFEIAHTAVEKLTVPSLLARLAADGQVGEGVAVRAAARLDDAQVLRGLARTAKHTEVRLATLKRIDHEPTLIAAATRDGEPSVRLAALKKLSHQPTLAKLARDKTADGWERVVAISRLEDRALLGQISKAHRPIHGEGYCGTSRTYSVHPIDRYYYCGAEGPVAALRLALLEAGKPVELSLVRVETSRRYTKTGKGNAETSATRDGETITLSLVETASGETIRQRFETAFPFRVMSRKALFIPARFVAFDLRDLLKDYLVKATTEDERASLAASARSLLLRAAALRTLERPDLVLAAAKSPPLFLQLSAVQQLSDQAALARIARKTKAKFIAKAAISRLTDRAALRDLAASEGWPVNELARERLGSLKRKN